ncbi:MAG: T9SS type A sorting domain-containing protein [Candidatus Eisenbacteria bacterium]|nr:T9SS type A sorting domain-containing protein [Candidatus Eisenbacteria bacterium]
MCAAVQEPRDHATVRADFIAIAAGKEHNPCLKSDGTVVAWGQNYSGQCDVPEPNTGFVAIAGGGWRGLGLKSPLGTGIPDNEIDDRPGAPALGMLSLAPNPFSPYTEPVFETSRPIRVTLEVYDISGRRVRAAPLGHVNPGLHRARWDGRDAGGLNVASGVYFVRLTGADGDSRTAKAVLIR